MVKKIQTLPFWCSTVECPQTLNEVAGNMWIDLVGILGALYVSLTVALSPNPGMPVLYQLAHTFSLKLDSRTLRLRLESLKNIKLF